ncbi:unnamed protein product [Allacma fusca]|uniref:Uncharacterized protein n=1 Tax=Allacma fusca TaxID=39272 RepID=A0A8J2LKK2_9HEXA|nr:unnamed protein product [Allacma fusca]
MQEVVTLLCGSCTNAKKSSKIRAQFFGFETGLKSGKFYRIDNSNGLTLTAAKEGRIKPEPVILSTWEEAPNQIWEVDRIDEGYIFTPVENDFNEVSYFLTKHADSSQTWKLGKPTKKIKNLKVGGMYLLQNSNLQCLEGFGKDEIVGFKTCRVNSMPQYWKFYEVDEAPL